MVTSLTVHSFPVSSLPASLAGLARGEHIGLDDPEVGDGDGGVDCTGVGNGVGSFNESTSISESGNVLSDQGGTTGQRFSNSSFFSMCSEDDERR